MNPCTCLGLPCGKRFCPIPFLDELAVHFVVWAHELDAFPALADVVDRFDVSLETAQRWRAALAGAYGIRLNDEPGAPADG